MKLPQCVICLPALLLFVSASRADSVALVPSRDATIYQDFPTQSDGAGQTMIAGTAGDSSPRRALIGFAIAGNVPAGSTVTGVQLRLDIRAFEEIGNPSGTAFGEDDLQRRVALDDVAEEKIGEHLHAQRPSLTGDQCRQR